MSSLISPRVLTLALLALAMATIIVAATHAAPPNVQGTVNEALAIVVQILTTILDVIVDFIGKVLDEIVRAARDLFGIKGQG